MFEFDPAIFILILAYYFFYSLDAYKTHKGVLPDASLHTLPQERRH